MGCGSEEERERRARLGMEDDGFCRMHRISCLLSLSVRSRYGEIVALHAIAQSRMTNPTFPSPSSRTSTVTVGSIKFALISSPFNISEPSTARPVRRSKVACQTRTLLSAGPKSTLSFLPYNSVAASRERYVPLFSASSNTLSTPVSRCRLTNLVRATSAGMSSQIFSVQYDEAVDHGGRLRRR